MDMCWSLVKANRRMQGGPAVVIINSNGRGLNNLTPVIGADMQDDQ